MRLLLKMNECQYFTVPCNEHWSMYENFYRSMYVLNLSTSNREIVGRKFATKLQIEQFYDLT